MTTHNDSHGDTIAPGDIVAYGGRRGNSGIGRAGRVVELGEKRVTVEWLKSSDKSERKRIPFRTKANAGSLLVVLRPTEMRVPTLPGLPALPGLPSWP